MNKNNETSVLKQKAHNYAHKHTEHAYPKYIYTDGGNSCFIVVVIIHV